MTLRTLSFYLTLTTTYLVQTEAAAYSFNEKDLFDDVNAKWYKQTLNLIALTHDRGHTPFSHESEALFDKELGHEDYPKKIIIEVELAHYIQDIRDAFRRKYESGKDMI